MWFFESHKHDHGQEVIRWTFLFASPVLFEDYESTIFSFLHLFIGVIVLILLTGAAEFLSHIRKEHVMSQVNWVRYGRIVNFAAHIVYNAIIASQIWTGLVIAKIATAIFRYHNNLYIFGAFSVALLFLLAVCGSILYPVHSLR
jgi:hypothetical protein